MDTTNPEQTVELPTNGEKREEKKRTRNDYFRWFACNKNKSRKSLSIITNHNSINRNRCVYVHTHAHTHLCSRREYKVDQILFTFTFCPPAGVSRLSCRQRIAVIHETSPRIELYAYLNDDEKRKDPTSPTHSNDSPSKIDFSTLCFSHRWFIVGQHSSGWKSRWWTTTSHNCLRNELFIGQRRRRRNDERKASSITSECRASTGDNQQHSARLEQWSTDKWWEQF